MSFVRNTNSTSIRKALQVAAAGLMAITLIGPVNLDKAEAAAATFSMEKIASYDSGAGYLNAGTEIVVYDWKGERAYSTNSAEKAIDIIDLSKLGQEETIERINRITIDSFHIDGFTPDGVTSVAVSPSGDYIAASVPASPKTDPGKVVFMKMDGTQITSVTVGSLPDMLTFSPNGKQLLVANEGEPNGYYEASVDREASIDPEGSVSIIDVTGEIDELTDADVATAGFGDVTIPEDVRIFGPRSSAAQDLEPEFIVVSADNKKAYVSLQENNAMAEVDLTTKQVTSVRALGFKDHSLPGNGLDASDRGDVIDIKPQPVLGMYLPDGMAITKYGSKSYILTANEGDDREYDGFAEKKRIKAIKDNIHLDAQYYEGFTQTELDAYVTSNAFGTDSMLGRLNVSAVDGLNDEGVYDRLYSYGTRSFSVWDAETGALVFDSGDQFEQLTKDHPFFNANNEESNMKDVRSAAKGPEPEYVEVGTVEGKTYAFIGLERISGVMVYDISNPKKPTYVTYMTSRVDGDIEANEAGDIAPEGLKFVPAAKSPTGKALLLAAHEVSGTIAVYEITAPKQPSTPTVPEVTPEPSPSATPEPTPTPTPTPEVKPGELNVTAEQFADKLKALPAGTNELAFDAGAPGDNGITVVLPAGVKSAAAANPNLVIVIEGDNVSYELPISAIDWNVVSKQLGGDAVKLTVSIRPANGGTNEQIEQAAVGQQVDLVTGALEFTVVAEGANGSKYTIASFGGTYNDRTITLDGTSVNGNTATAVRFDEATGRLVFVPSTFTAAGGDTIVNMKRNGNSVYTVINGSKTFDDAASHWAKPAIDSLASKLIVSGVDENHFAPNKAITRAEFTAIIVRSLGLNEAAAGSGFSDVSASKWYAGEIQTAVQAGVISGYEDGTFRPEQTITRQEIASILMKAVHYADANTAAAIAAKAESLNPLSAIKDAGSIAAWAKTAAAEALAAGIVEGKADGAFAPVAKATRAEAVTMLQRTLKQIGFIN
ncbi:choice-of-anchor I family protein [Paenibacillus sp. YIM B09110]|uniref:choice-of-anchor I family protein n=1 Tax=Paenibacillus sp. YIM B09110 TaxID=3126102 RepID=UPI00301C08AC